MEAPPFPGANAPIDPEVEAAIAAEHARVGHARAEHPVAYFFGHISAALFQVVARLGLLFGVLLLTLVVIGGFDFDLREVLGIAATLAVIGVAARWATT